VNVSCVREGEWTDGVDFEDMARDVKIDGQEDGSRDNKPSHHSRQCCSMRSDTFGSAWEFDDAPTKTKIALPTVPSTAQRAVYPFPIAEKQSCVGQIIPSKLGLQLHRMRMFVWPSQSDQNQSTPEQFPSITLLFSEPRRTYSAHRVQLRRWKLNHQV
jgi:hypothetical protein